MSTDGIHVTRWGAGPPILMVHGSAQGNPAGGSDHWAAQRPLADQGWELVLPDRPGHGLSPSRGSEDFEADARWIAEMLGDGGHLVGHSYGGAASLCAAGLRPDAVRSLTLIEAPVFSAAADRREARELKDRLADASSARNPVVAVVKFARALGIPRGVLKPRPTLRQAWRMGKRARTMRHPWTWDAGTALAQVTDAHIPALIVTGGWSPGFEAIGDGLAQALGGQRVTMDVGHHFPQLADEGTPFNEVLGGFLAKRRDQSSAAAR
jgi:pimeloyl-ACP methyl ester carboxylesterase